jgi:hypothetical protein
MRMNAIFSRHSTLRELSKSFLKPARTSLSLVSETKITGFGTLADLTLIPRYR